MEMSARSAKRAGAGWCARTGLAGAAPNSTCHSLSKFIWKSQEPTAPELQSNSELPKRSGAVKRPPPHVAGWIAISAGSGRNVYMQQIAPEKVLCVLVAKEALLLMFDGEKKPALGGLNAHCVRKPESCLSQIITAGQHCIR